MVCQKLLKIKRNIEVIKSKIYVTKFNVNNGPCIFVLLVPFVYSFYCFLLDFLGHFRID